MHQTVTDCMETFPRHQRAESVKACTGDCGKFLGVSEVRQVVLVPLSAKERRNRSGFSAARRTRKNAAAGASRNQSLHYRNPAILFPPGAVLPRPSHFTRSYICKTVLEQFNAYYRKTLPSSIETASSCTIKASLREHASWYSHCATKPVCSRGFARTKSDTGRRSST